MTKRQLTGFAVVLLLVVSLMLSYWLGPIFGYTVPKWVYVIAAIVAFGWGDFYYSRYAKKR